MTFTWNPDGSISPKVDPEDFVLIGQFFQRLFPKRTEYLNYTPSYLISTYSNKDINLLRSPNKVLYMPYEIVFDYRNNLLSDWGTFEFIDDYIFPNALAEIKRILVARRAKNLNKGDNPCPRVHNVEVSKDSFKIFLQKAMYFDQVGTNLSLDFKLDEQLSKQLGASTIREWDLSQSNTKKGNIPALPDSQLANTIGIAMSIIAKNKYGQKVILYRRRRKNVAVYANQYSLPFSFALNTGTHSIKPGFSGKIKDLIITDFYHEIAEELGVETSDIDFGEVKPLLFCRDLVRGGKPQFFFRDRTESYI